VPRELKSINSDDIIYTRNMFLMSIQKFLKEIVQKWGFSIFGRVKSKYYEKIRERGDFRRPF